MLSVKPVAERLFRAIDAFASKGYTVKEIGVTLAEDMVISLDEFPKTLPEGLFRPEALDTVVYQFGSFQELDITEEELLDSLIEWIEGLPEVE